MRDRSVVTIATVANDVLYLIRLRMYRIRTRYPVSLDLDPHHCVSVTSGHIRTNDTSLWYHLVPRNVVSPVISQPRSLRGQIFSPRPVRLDSSSAFDVLTRLKMVLDRSRLAPAERLRKNNRVRRARCYNGKRIR